MSWKAGEFTVPASSGSKLVSGWVTDLFALDFRPTVSGEEGGVDGGYGWCLTHRPSGYAMWGLILSLAEAMAVADELAAIPGFSDLRAPGVGVGPDPAFMKRRAAPIRDRLGIRCINPLTMIPPWADAPELEVRLAEAPG